MKFKPNLEINEVITNQQLIKIFKCANSSGMRRSHATNTLTIISDYTKNFYTDIYDGGVLKYTGMGLKGDQKLSGNQNLTLYESDTNNVDVHWFEVFSKNEYTYRGIVKLVGTPYMEAQDDFDGNSRMVWIFPLAVVEEIQDISTSQEIMYNEMLKLNDNIPMNIVSISEEEIPSAESKGKGKHSKRSGKRDYLKEAKRKSKIGILGEYMILDFEKERLAKLGREDLADEIYHVASKDDSAGFDIISFELDAEGTIHKKYIEVKTTTSSSKSSFYISKNEFEVMKDLKDQYWIYRVYKAESKKPKFYKATYYDLQEKYEFIPQNFMVKLKPIE